MKKELADYILCLSECLAHTKQANDRQYYTMYLADAAVILALVEIESDKKVLKQKVDTHERLICNTWITNEDDYKSFYAAWGKFKRLLR